MISKFVRRRSNGKLSLFFRFVFLKRFLTWWYHRKIKKNEVALDKLRKEKTKILDAVMETETYKVTKELLDEFASDSEKRTLNVSTNFHSSSSTTTTSHRNTQNSLYDHMINDYIV